MDDSPHNSAPKKFDLSLIEFDEDERVVCEIRKHPFGLFVIYFVGFTISFITIASGIFGSAWLEANASSGLGSYTWLVFVVSLVVSVLVLIMMFISAFLYRNNIILVTNEKIAQLLYTTIFNRTISQLNLGDVQDVTVVQKGVFARVFNYGTLVIETAGEQNNYNFTYAPAPYACSREIITVHEESIAKFGN